MTKAGKALISIALVAMTVTSGLALAAGARKLPQSGPVDGDDAATVELVVIKAAGKPKAVKGVTVKDLLATCETGEERITLKLFGAAKVISPGGIIDRHYGSEDERMIRIQGKVSHSGKRVTAQIKGRRDAAVPISGVGTCEIPKFTFTTRPL